MMGLKGMTELLKGVLEGVVLQVIQNKRETYGYEITNDRSSSIQKPKFIGRC